MLDDAQKRKLIAFARALIDQRKARVIVAPDREEPGFWFGGGNLTEGPDGALYLTGRYRQSGDSRTGLAGGRRGRELAVLRSADRGRTFQRVLSFRKADLDPGGRAVLSIEGSALRFTPEGGELFVSSEKDGIGYPGGLESYLKPGTGVWTIEHLRAEGVEALKRAAVRTVLASSDPRFLHVKDPFFFPAADGRARLGFCTHPFCWTSSNTGCADLRADGTVAQPRFDIFRRGFTWDVAITRATAVLDVPPVGALKRRRARLVFYDGGECVRNHQQHEQAVRRPRGYSCEELGGLAYFLGDDAERIERLSVTAPLFVSPWGTGCSRYVDVLATDDAFYATWQQSQPSGAQPLVLNVLAREQADRLLS